VTSRREAEVATDDRQQFQHILHQYMCPCTHWGQKR
jgi:hypothetical protein